MSLFLVLMAAGLLGMILMALPGLGHHGHAGIGSHGAAGHFPLLPKATHAPAHGTAGHAQIGQGRPMTRFLPAPRTIFGFLALYGAFGNALEKAGHLNFGLSAVLAVVPAALIERYLLTPLWNRLMAFQGEPCPPLEELLMQEAKAVTPFRSGRGMVSVVHDGRLVQMRADLVTAQAAIPVAVGDVLRVEEIDARHERVTVSLR